MQRSITITQHLTRKEFIRATAFYYYTAKKLRLFFLFITALSLGSLVLGTMTTSKPLTIADILPGLASILGLLLILTIFIIAACSYLYKSRPYLFKNVSYEFSPSGIIRHGEKAAFSKQWKDIFRYKESKSFILLYVGNNDFHIIQKRSFNSPDELTDFRNLLREKINR